MEIRMGIATEYAKEKFDITLDETDLHRLCLEHGITVVTAAEIPVRLAYLLLEKEAERYVLVQAPKYGRPVEAVQAQLDQNRVEFAKIVAAVKEELDG